MGGLRLVTLKRAPRRCLRR